MPITSADINEYHRNPNMRHGYYKESVQKYKDLHDHFVDKPNMDLITKARPNESPILKKYREEIAVPMTKEYLWKAALYFMVIRRSRDWNINYGDTTGFSSIASGELPNIYLEKKIPAYQSITNWAFSNLLIQYDLDANGVVLTIPRGRQPENEYKTPAPTIFNSPQIIDYRLNEYYVLESAEVIFYKERDNFIQGKCYYVVDNDQIARYDQTTSTGDFILNPEYTITNTLGRLPVHHLFGVVLQSNGLNVLADSRLSPMAPHLQEHTREYNDLQLAIIKDLHPKEWAITSQDCDVCNGKTKIPAQSATGKAVWIKCGACNGGGKKLPGPFSVDYITPVAGQTPITPPRGYVQQSTEIIKMQAERIKEHGYNSLKSINLQHIDEVYAGDSGIKKALDMDGSYNTVHSVAEDIVRIMDLVNKDIIDWRYSLAVKNPEEREKLVPIIAVPDKFDMASTDKMLQDLSSLINANADSSIIKAVNIDLANKLFSSDKDKAMQLSMEISLDPLAGLSDEIISTGETLGTISKEDATIHRYKRELIAKAIVEDKDFASKSYLEQMEVMRRLAKEKNAAVDVEEEEEEEEEEVIQTEPVV